MTVIRTKTGIDGDMELPNSASVVADDIIQIEGSGQVTFMARATHANTTGFSWRFFLQPDPRGEGPARHWYTDATAAAGMQGDVDTSTSITLECLVLPVDIPPGARAYLQIHTITGANKSVDLCVMRRG